jgi:Cdc6-like AAA superfamily ATPase
MGVEVVRVTRGRLPAEDFNHTLRIIVDYSKLNLKDNPFMATPGNGNQVWCGMVELKHQLEQRIETSLKTSPSALIINWGHYGSGKTHAARFFTDEANLNALANKANAVTAPLAFYVSFPRVDRGAASNLTSMILGKFGMSGLSDMIQKTKAGMDQVDTELFPKLLNQFCQDSELQKIFSRLVDANQQYVDALGRILFSNASAGDLKELQLSRKPDSLSDQCRIVTTVFNLLTFRSELIPPRYSTIFLWIDEFEDIGSLAAREQDALAAYLRNLLDWSPRFLTILLNFTLSPIQQVKDLSIYLGNAVSSRIRQRIEFSEPNSAQIKDYIQDMLGETGVRISTNVAAESPYHPFDSQAIDLIAGSVDPRTPRTINDVCTYFLDLAAGTDGQNEINAQFVKDHAAELGIEIKG